MSANAFDWHMSEDDCLEAQSHGSALGMFTRLHIRYADPTTGEEGMALGVNQPKDYPAFDKLVPEPPKPAARLTQADAWALAEQAAAVLGGKPVDRWWLQVAPDRLLECSDGVQRPANLLADSDCVMWKTVLSKHVKRFHVIDVKAGSDAIHLSLSDREDHDRFADLELRLISL